MSFRVLTGGGGLGGWNFLGKTADRQRDIIAKSGDVRSLETYFRDNIGKIGRPADLVSDYRVLSVALKAFGLEGDQNNRHFIQRVVEEGVTGERALANRLSNKAYQKLAAAFGYLSTGSAAPAGFADRIVAQFVEREFELRVGEGDPNLRLALNAKRELAALANRASSNKTKWYEIIGSPPLRKVFEGAFGFDAKTYGKLPVDRQLEEFSKAAEKMLGSAEVSVFNRADAVETLVRRFLVRGQASTAVATNRFGTALTLLQGA